MKIPTSARHTEAERLRTNEEGAAFRPTPATSPAAFNAILHELERQKDKASPLFFTSYITQLRKRTPEKTPAAKDELGIQQPDQLPGFTM